MKIFVLGDDVKDEVILVFTDSEGSKLDLKCRYLALQTMSGFSECSTNRTVSDELTLVLHTRDSKTEDQLFQWLFSVNHLMYEDQPIKKVAQKLVIEDATKDWSYGLFCAPMAIGLGYTFKGVPVVKARFSVLEWKQIIEGDEEYEPNFV